MPTGNPSPFDSAHLPPGVEPPSGTDPRQIGEYRVVGRIGAGGMGAVYAGVDPRGGCAAVKVIHPQFAVNPEFLARFAREIELVSRVRATCTAAFVGADVRAGTPWLATEYVRGRTLRQYVRENGPVSGGVLFALAAGLAEALAAIHGADVVHRDLKPGNVILSPDGPKVLDFGIARAVDATALTRTGGLLGTPGWMAPEQYLGEEATARSDMFAWGGMVAFAATGRNPFGKGGAEVLVHRTREGEPDLDGVPDELLDLVRRAMGKAPERRPTAEEVLDELTSGWNATRVQPVKHVPSTQVVPELLATEWRGVTAPEARRVRRTGRGLLFAGAAATLAVALLGTSLFVWSGLGGDPSDGAPPSADAADAGEAGGTGEAGEAALAVEAGPDDISAVLEEAVTLAREASSFSTFSTTDSGDVGDSQSHHFLYSEDPEPTYVEMMTAGAIAAGHVEIGEGPDDVLQFTETIDPGSNGDYVRNFYRDPDEATDIAPRTKWEGELDRLDELRGEDAEVGYQGLSSVPTDYLPAALAGDRDMASRKGHHYTGTLSRAPIDAGGPEREIAFDLWIGEDGHPQRFQTEERWEQMTEAGEPFRLETYELTFIHFNEAEEIELPDESEIADSREEVSPW